MTGKDTIDKLNKLQFFYWCKPTKTPEVLKQDIETVERDFELIRKDLEVLEIFKKYLHIRVSEKTSFGDKYFVALQEDEEQECDYTCIFVSKEEKELLKGWLDNDQ